MLLLLIQSLVGVPFIVPVIGMLLLAKSALAQFQQIDCCLLMDIYRGYMAAAGALLSHGGSDLLHRRDHNGMTPLALLPFRSSLRPLPVPPSSRAPLISCERMKIPIKYAAPLLTPLSFHHQLYSFGSAVNMQVTNRCCYIKKCLFLFYFLLTDCLSMCCSWVMLLTTFNIVLVYWRLYRVIISSMVERAISRRVQ
jgi:hypothetical protein